MKKAVLMMVVGALTMPGVAMADSLYTLDPVVVTANKITEELGKVPASISVVTSEDIEKHNYTSTAQALGQLPGIYLSPVADGGISMRGFSSSDMLVTVDGQPINTGWNGSVDWSMIPVENIEKIEVVRGAASSLYGGRATGGVIAITTKAHEEGLHGNVLLSYGSNDTTKQVYQASVKKDKWDIGVGYEKRKTDGWRGYFIDKKTSSATSGTAADLDQSARGRYILGGRGAKALDTESWHVKTAYHFNDHQTISYSYFHTNYNYSYENPFSYVKDSQGNEIFGGTAIVSPGKGITFEPGDFLGYTGKKEWGVHNFAYDDTKNNFHARFGYTDIKKDGYSSTAGSGISDSVTGEELNKWNGAGTLSFYPSKTKDFDIHKVWELGEHTLLVGAGYRANSFDQTRYYLARWRDHDSKTSAYEIHQGKDEAFSGYLQDKWQANDKLAVYAGVRFDRYKKYGGYDWFSTGVSRSQEEATYTEWSPKFSVEYAIDDSLTLYASYGHSFTPPVLYQVYRSEGAPIENVGGQLTVNKKGSLANPDLKPETTDTYEIGLKKKWGNDTAASIAMYKMDTDDAVRYYSTTKSTLYNGILYKKGFTQYRNAGEAKKKGFEIDVKHRLSDKLSAYLNYAWEQEKVDGEINYDVPKHLLHFGFEFTHKRWDILADAQYVSARQSPDTDTGMYYAEDDFFIANLAVNYAFTPKTVAQFSVYNLFDREFYASEAASERTYAISLRHSF